MSFNEQEARDENVRSLRSIALCIQMLTRVTLRQFAGMNIGQFRAKDLEYILDKVSVDDIEE